MANSEYDMIIAGAGIHGAAVARQAVEHGYSVLVLEQYESPAQGTSGRSSKLVHGGLRYLETFNIGLVRECLLDRKRLLDKYPDLVRLRRFFIPIYKETNRSRLAIKTGLSLYGMLSKSGKYGRHRKIFKREWDALDGIKKEDLTTVYQYWDAQTDDVKLTKRLIQEAEEQKADILFNAKIERCDRKSDSLLVTYIQDGKVSEVSGKYFINATGPWVNEVLEKCSPKVPELPIERVQGTHIELPGELKKGIYYFEAPQDKRAVYAMPWHGHILFGTTETIYKGAPEKVEPTMLEISYLLTIFNHYFPDNPVEGTDIIKSWAGLRVLPFNDKVPFKRSREAVFHSDNKRDPRIISIYGGQLTSHQSTAEKLLKLMAV